MDLDFLCGFSAFEIWWRNATTTPFFDYIISFRGIIFNPFCSLQFRACPQLKCDILTLVLIPVLKKAIFAPQFENN